MFKSIFGVLQKVGKALMLPIAILPAAGLLLGIGDALQNSNLIAQFPWLANESIAVIADVHTARGNALEEAVGYADELYALVEMEGYLYITRGAVFSYYEFTQSAPDRLTDEKWQEMLRAGKAPARPGWIENFLLNMPAEPLPERYTYSSGC